MKKYIYKIIFILFLFSFLYACNDENTIEYTKEPSEENIINSLVEQLVFQRSETALSAYELALIRAKEWDQNAVLYEIPSTVIMSNNIELLTPGSHWFFKFGTKDSPREFFVAVSDRKISGTLQAQPFSFENVPYKLLPIEIEKIIDSDEALKCCVKNVLLNPNTILENNQIIDYRLINLSGNPVWSIYLSDANPFIPTCNIDAITGEVTIDPFKPYSDLEQ